jgi:hypothetical protein
MSYISQLSSTRKVGWGVEVERTCRTAHTHIHRDTSWLIYGIFWRLGYKVWQGTVNPPRKLTNGSIPLVSTKEPGLVDQLVRLLACHARGRGFESRPVRQ